MKKVWHVLVHGVGRRESIIADGYETIHYWCRCGLPLGKERMKIPT